MAPIEELQLLWQSQATPTVRAFDARSLSVAFRKIGRRQDIINIAKSVLIAGTLVSSGITYRHRPLMLLSTTLLLLTAGLAILAEWRIQRGIARLDFSAASLDFVRETNGQVISEPPPHLLCRFTCKLLELIQNGCRIDIRDCGGKVDSSRPLTNTRDPLFVP